MGKKYFTGKKEIIVWLGFLLLLCLPVALMPFYQPSVDMKSYIVVVLFLFSVFFVMTSVYWGYPILTNKGLEIRNVLYFFYRKRYAYEDIRKIEISVGSIYHWPCLRIYLKSSEKSYFHCIDCMSGKSISAFVEELSSKGVEVICPADYKR
jgi:hypothetical protein